MNNFLHWIGWFPGDKVEAAALYASAGDFWSHPLWLTVSFILFVANGARVIYHEARDTWADTLYFALVSLLFLMAFAVGTTGGNHPHYLVKSLLVLLAVRSVWRAGTNYIRRKRG